MNIEAKDRGKWRAIVQAQAVVVVEHLMETEKTITSSVWYKQSHHLFGINYHIICLV